MGNFTTANVQSRVQRAMQLLANLFVMGEGEAFVAPSTRDKSGKPRFKVESVKGTKYQKGLRIIASGGSGAIICGDGSEDLDRMGAIPLAVATAVARVQGQDKGKAPDATKLEVLQRWNQILKADPLILPDADNLLIRARSGQRKGGFLKVSVLGLDWNITPKQFPTSMAAAQAIFTPKALESLTVNGEGVAAYLKGLKADQDAAEAATKASAA